MKKAKLYFVLGFIIGWAATYFYGVPEREPLVVDGGKYGNWIATQHAIFINDFDSAVKFIQPLKGVKTKSVVDVRNLVLFLESGDVAGEISGNPYVQRITKVAMLAKSGKWNEVYKDFRGEHAVMLMPFRIWSSVATGKIKEAFEGLESVPLINDSWRNFTRGAIYAATKNPKTARKYFSKVPSSFMNLGDYYLVMSFYKNYGFTKSYNKLQKEWISSPGGMYMADIKLNEDWKYYDSYQKMLAASLIQNVSHNPEIAFSDLSLLLLRVASMLDGQPDNLNYYTGGYFYTVGSENYKKYWDKIENNPIYAPFIEMKNAEKSGSTRELRKLVQKSPLFMPATIKLCNQYISLGDESKVMALLNKALKHKKLPKAGRAELLKMRAHTSYVFSDFDAAESDLEESQKLAPRDAEIISLQARVWAAKNKNIDEAYRYAISLIKTFPGEIGHWDTLAIVVLKKEGLAPALEILERVGRVAETNSELFLHLGELCAKTGLKARAAAAYKKAIALSEDGLIIKDEAIRKLRRLK